jgi:hypothetical protein
MWLQASVTYRSLGIWQVYNYKEAGEAGAQCQLDIIQVCSWVKSSLRHSHLHRSIGE